MTKRERLDRVHQASMYLAAAMQAAATGEEDPAKYLSQFHVHLDECHPDDTEYLLIMEEALEIQQGMKPHPYPELMPSRPEITFSVN